MVAAQILLTAAALTGLTGLTVTGRLWRLAVLFGALVLWAPATGLLNGATRGLLELRGPVLGERQLAERGTVHTVAHRTSFALMVLAFTAFLLIHRGIGVPLSHLAVPVAVTALGVLAAHWLLPLWAAALRVPDEPADDACTV